MAKFETPSAPPYGYDAEMLTRLIAHTARLQEQAAIVLLYGTTDPAITPSPGEELSMRVGHLLAMLHKLEARGIIDPTRVRFGFEGYMEFMSMPDTLINPKVMDKAEPSGIFDPTAAR